MAEPLPSLDTAFVPSMDSFESPATAEKPQLRFAEDISATGPAKSHGKSRKKKKKSTRDRESDEEGGGRKSRRGLEIPIDEEEDY